MPIESPNLLSITKEKLVLVMKTLNLHFKKFRPIMGHYNTNNCYKEEHKPKINRPYIKINSQVKHKLLKG